MLTKIVSFTLIFWLCIALLVESIQKGNNEYCTLFIIALFVLIVGVKK